MFTIVSYFSLTLQTFSNKYRQDMYRTRIDGLKEVIQISIELGITLKKRKNYGRNPGKLSKV